MNYTKISIKTNSEYKPPYFIGSQLRGAFGYALKKTTCINPSFSCDTCFAKNNCLYYEFYEEKNSFHKYRFDFKLAPKKLEFNLFLLDSSCEQTPYIISALHQMLNKTGLSKERVTFEDLKIYVNDTLSFDGSDFFMPEEIIQSFEAKNYSKNIKLTLKTPLRMKKNNKYIRDNSIELEDIIKSIYQRESNLKGLGFQKIPFTPSYTLVDKNIYFKDVQRYSNRQKQKMQLGGVMGEFIIKDIDKQSFEILKLGEIIGAGKQSVFGLGKLEVEGI